jgi:glycosyltransferase involved in cell wall biosynthesis
LNLSTVDTVHRVNNTTNIQAIYQKTKILLIPSIWWETLGRVAIEAQINGIPLIASPCGALSDVVSYGGVLLPIPIPDNQVQATTPSAEDIKPWCDTIIELWDSPERYQEVSQLAQQASDRWQEEVMIAAWQSYLQHWVRQKSN